MRMTSSALPCLIIFGVSCPSVYIPLSITSWSLELIDGSNFFIFLVATFLPGGGGPPPGAATKMTRREKGESSHNAELFAAGYSLFLTSWHCSLATCEEPTSCDCFEALIEPSTFSPYELSKNSRRFTVPAYKGMGRGSVGGPAV